MPNTFTADFGCRRELLIIAATGIYKNSPQTRLSKENYKQNKQIRP